MRKLIFNSINKVRPIWRILLFLLITFGINVPLQMGLQKILDQGLLRGVISGSIYLMSVVFSLWIQIKFLDRSSFKKYGLQINSVWLKECFVGMVIPLIQLSIFFAILYLTGNLTIGDYFTTNVPNYSFIEGLLSQVFSLIIGTSVEEIFFRALLFYAAYEAFRKLQKDAHKRALLILLLISPLFGIAHIDNTGATLLSTINLGLDAIAICLPFLISGRLGMSIGMHFSWNLVQGTLFGFATSGHLSKVNIISIDVTDNLITGGTFGPEGSILFIFLDLIAIGLILYWKQRNDYKHWVHPYVLEHAVY